MRGKLVTPAGLIPLLLICVHHICALTTEESEWLSQAKSLGHINSANCGDSRVTCINDRVTKFICDNCGLTGTIPPLSNLPFLQEYVAPRNSLVGPLPSFDQNSEILILNLDDNNIDGTLPSLDGLAKLQVAALAAWCDCVPLDIHFLFVLQRTLT